MRTSQAKVCTALAGQRRAPRKRRVIPCRRGCHAVSCDVAPAQLIVCPRDQIVRQRNGVPTMVGRLQPIVKPADATRNTQHATRNMQHATRNMQHATCNMQHATCNMQHATRNTQHATRNMQHATRNMRAEVGRLERCQAHANTSGRIACAHSPLSVRPAGESLCDSTAVRCYE